MRRGARGLEEEHEYQPPVEGLLEGGNTAINAEDAPSGQ